ncbi:MAG: ABC transporter transmembrane domain-containing protein [Metamycoplasmataceae bacterium]
MKWSKNFKSTNKEIKTNYKESWSLFWKYYKKNKKWTISIVLLSILSSLTTISLPFITIFMNESATATKWEPLIFATIILSVVSILQIVIFYISNYVSGIFNMKIETQIREEMMSKIHHLSMETFDNAPIGIFFSRFFSDLQEVKIYASKLIRDTVTIFCLIVGGFSFIFYVNWVAGIIILSVYIFALLIYAFFKQNLVYHQQINKSLRTFMSIGLGEHVQMVSEIKSFSNSLTTVEKFETLQKNYYNSTKKYVRKSTLFNLAGTASAILISTITLIIGSFLMHDNKISSPGLLGLILAANILIIPIERTSTLITDLIILNANIVRIKEFHNWKFENNEGLIKKPFVGNIEFKNVSFSYKTKNDNIVNVFNNFNLVIPENERTLLYSDKASGLTTIFKLIMRYYEVDSGEILLDGINIKNYDIDYLRKHITYQAFSPKLFSSSLELETLYPDAERYNKIVESLNIKELIKKKEMLDKNINSQGMQLSDSEKQMLSIVRALYFDTPIILFDFPEHCLNKHQLESIEKTLNIFAKDKTIVFNSHNNNIYFKIDNFIKI